MKNIMFFITLTLAQALLISCGGGTSGTAALDTSFNKDLRISELSTADAELFCEETRDYIRKLINEPEILCGYVAVSDSIDESDLSIDNCELTRTICIDLFNNNDRAKELADSYSCTKTVNSINCSATIGELEACLDLSFNFLTASLSSISCNAENLNLTENELETVIFSSAEEQAENTAPCQVVQQKCPGFFD